ncbi:MAG: replicative DNA helicase [Candidatus Doudnabacteria bacterium RIFCSPHIGHO2_01_FULL_49_9]|uniref:Replicative DNA helicase n=1 Tax=Candidatus Doudnabacteria bacterium RIFCSPHIGHO2_01_FULL_49_9 TaxID=1817827 RepID=A0A1F5P225_9BACT|nr:MAG: replicative DNA helicase [Candidatus Doudnabacteria bacterium RIFCSPHIGHO2_01_FULL_49_9]
MPSTKDLRLPPQDLEAEQSVLGSLMIDKDAIFAIADVLVPDDFYKKANAIIFEAALRLWGRREPIDSLSVGAELKKMSQLKEVGGSTYLTEVINSVPTASHVAHYAKIVKEKRILRELISASADITESAMHSDKDLEHILDAIESRVFSISQRSIAKNFVIIKDELKAAYERIEKLHHGDGNKLRGVSTGFTELDNKLSGLQKSDLIIIGARPSYGKTTLALDIARHASVRNGETVGFFSLEMSREQVIDRLIAAEAQVDLWKLRTGRLRDDMEFGMIQSAFDKFNKAPFFIDDTPSPNIVQMRSMARRLQAEHGSLGLLVVDYLQLIQPRSNFDSTVAQVTEISRGLKGLARELNVPIIAVSQLSRGVEQRDVKTPRLSDLRESGSIEQDADVVILIHPKNRDKTELSPEEQNMVDIIIAKHRNGPIGTINLYFNKEKVSFQNVDKIHQDTGEIHNF